MSTPRPKILWGLTGSVAAIRADRILASLQQVGEVQAVVTKASSHFYGDMLNAIPVHDDQSEWAAWNTLGDPILHIELRRWADVFVIAPLSADALAKMSAGICDNVLLCVARAWDFQKPFLVAPAMNTFMWSHPTTAEHIERIQRWGVTVVPPVEKQLACADVGMGALATPEAIAKATQFAIQGR